ncbi:MAG: VTT domain-containing protein [Planctomycetota bacterium]
MSVLQFGGDDLTALVDQYGLAAITVTIPIHALIAATPLFPSDVLAIAYGGVFGYATAVLLAWIGWWLGAILEFYLVRSAHALATARAKDDELQAERRRAPAWLRRIPVAHPLFLILGRQVPWGGAHIVIIPAAIGGVTWRRFLWCSAISIVPGALLLPAIGAKLWGT